MDIRRLAKQVRRFVAPRRGVPAVGTVSEVAAVYDDVFKTDADFDTLDESNSSKLPYVIAFAGEIGGPILDAGCGRGSVLRHMLDHDIDAFGIELSAAACEMYLRDLPHANADIIAWAEAGHRYAGLICTDVLEHIPPDQIDAVMAALARMAPVCLLGIANHSSIHNGHELHVIQQGRRWWMGRLKDHFAAVELVEPAPGDEVQRDHLRHDRFFFLKAQE